MLLSLNLPYNLHFSRHTDFASLTRRQGHDGGLYFLDDLLEVEDLSDALQQLGQPRRGQEATFALEDAQLLVDLTAQLGVVEAEGMGY